VLDDRYRILERLAEGSMGAVYRGERVPLGRPVAIKVLHASFVQDAEFVGRFEREVRVMSKLAHPNCVSVIDLGAKPTPYVVIDFIDGQTLQHMLDDGPLPVPRAIDIIRQVLAGLAHAHAQNIVHRDIKPANVMVTQEIGKGDHARILDFGLAMLRSGASVVSTQTHIVVGTPAYMSPEQTLGSKVGPASDLYSTGCVLFELLTGKKPYDADDTFELLGKHRAAPVPRLHEAAPGTKFPVGLQSVLETAMAKEPGARFGSAIEFADALAQVAIAGDAVAPPTRPSTPPPVRTSGSGPAAVPAIADNADTVQDQPRLDAEEPHWHDKVGGRRGLGLFGALLLVAGAAVLTWKVSARWHAAEDSSRPAAPVATLPGAAGVDASAAGAAAAPLAPLLADAAAPMEVLPDAGVPDAVPGPPDAGEPDAAPGAPDPVAAEVERDAGAPAPLPTPDQQPTPEPELKDEESPPPAPPAPPTPEPPKPITTLDQALAAAKAGRREAAITALHGFWKKDPKSPWYPYYLGNLYYEKGWWGTGIDHYRAAIAKRASLKRSERIIANCIRALAFTKSRSKAVGLLKTIGKAAVPALKRAAKNDRNANVRKYAAYLARTIRR
jgi:serine/threonine-protein kinase